MINFRIERHIIYVLTAYIFLTAIFTYPVIFTDDKIPGDGGDGYQCLWFLWWYKTAILNLNNPYHTDYIFYPTGVSLAFSGMSPINAILSIPIQLIFGLTLSYNILWLISFIIAGYGTYLLVKYLTDNKMAAFVSGLIFMFSPYHFAHGLGHFNLTTIEWIPFYVLYLFKMINENRERNIIYAAFFLLLVALSEYYYLIYLSTFTIIFFLYNLLTDNKNILKKNIIKRFSIMVILFGLIFLPFAYPLLKELTVSESSYMYVGGFVEYSADLLGFFIPTQFHPILGDYVRPIYKNFTGNWAEHTVYIGYTVLFLASFAIFKIKTKEIRFWSLSAIIFFILTLGPILHVNGKLFDFIKLPYSVIMNIPIISIARVPSRWAVLVMLSLAVLAGYGLSRILNKENFKDKKIQKIIVIIFSGLILFEYLSIPYPMSSTEIPNFYHELRNDTDDYAIFEIPFRGIYMYYQTFHEKKMVNGYVSRTPSDVKMFVELTPFISQLLRQSKDAMIDDRMIDYGKSILNYFNIRYIVLHKNYLNKEQIDIANNLLQNISEDIQIYEKDKLVVYKIKKVEPKSFILLKDNFNSGTIDKMKVVWMSNNGTILIYSPDSRDYNISFCTISFYKPRLLQIYLDDELVQQQIIDTNLDSKQLELRLKEGDNTIKFYSPDECQRPVDIPELKSKDTRCLNMAFTDISLT